jgi:L-asparaginase II
MTVSAHLAVEIEVPQREFAGDVPLVAVMRGEYVGSLHRGAFAVSDASGRTLVTAGDATQAVFLRSSAKPFQAMPAALSGALDQFGLTEEETAVLCASHHAEARQMEVVLNALAKAGLGEDALRCGIHPPIDPISAANLIREGIVPSPVCNNCSGAHTGMLLACVANGWPIDNYGNKDHPLQQQTIALLAAFAGVQPHEIELAIDNCAVPTFRLPIAAAARAFATLVDSRRLAPHLRTAATRLTRAMMAHPQMVSGVTGFDTALMQAAPGEIACKGGAEAFQGIGWFKEGLGVAIKISDGNPRAIAPVATRILEALGALDPAQLERLDAFRRPVVMSARDEPVGEILPLFQMGTTA